MNPQLESPLKIKLSKQNQVIESALNFNTMKKINRRHTTFGRDLFNRPSTAARDRLDPSYSIKTRDQSNETAKRSVGIQNDNNVTLSGEQIVMKHNKFRIKNQYLGKDELLINQEKLLNIFLDKGDMHRGEFRVQNAYGKYPF